MPIETEQLVVLLEARIAQFERNMAKAAKTADTNFKSIEDRASRSADVTAKGLERSSVAITRHSGLARYELINLSRQVQDVGVSLISGQSPFMVLAQQGTQIADIFGNSRGTLRGFASQITAMVTPVRALALGTAATGAAAYAAVSYWKSYALALDDLARSSGVAVRDLSALQAAASFKGIEQEDFAGGMKAFAQAVYEAKTGANDLSKLLRVNGQEVGNTATSLERVADLVMRSRDDQQRLNVLRQAGLPATMEWVRLLEKGATGIREAQAQAVAFGGAVNDQMVRKAREFDEAWHKAWTNFGISVRSGVVTASGWLDTLIEKGREAVGAFDRATGGKGLRTVGENLLKGGFGTSFGPGSDLYGGFNWPGSKETSSTRDPAEMQRGLQVEQQRISILGELATVQDRVRLKEIELQQAGLAGVGVSREQRNAILARTEAEALGLTAMRDATNAMRIEIDAFGMSTGAAAAHRLEQERLNYFRSRGIPLTQQQTEAIKNEAEAYGKLVALNDALREMEGVGSSALSGFIRDLRDGKNGAEAMRGALLKLADAAIDFASKALVKSALGGLSGLFVPQAHSGYGPGDTLTPSRLIAASAVASAPRFHSGVGPGERVAVLREDESVLTPGQMRQLAPVGGGGTDVAISFTINAPNSQKGAGEDIARTMAAFVRSQEFQVSVWQAMKKGQSHRWS